jgi:hypothetical protein
LVKACFNAGGWGKLPAKRENLKWYAARAALDDVQVERILQEAHKQFHESMRRQARIALVIGAGYGDTLECPPWQ